MPSFDSFVIYLGWRLALLRYFYEIAKRLPTTCVAVSREKVIRYLYALAAKGAIELPINMEPVVNAVEEFLSPNHQGIYCTTGYPEMLRLAVEAVSPFFDRHVSIDEYLEYTIVEYDEP